MWHVLLTPVAASWSVCGRRSLVAAFDLTQEGLTNVQVMKDGYTGWFNSGRCVGVVWCGALGELLTPLTPCMHAPDTRRVP
jgi:hypothetical protein